ncbi:MAG: hypothetical protein HA493_01310 [Candidatus Verstraetearchaeota archaeon]|nr:hypothetical protein [Candidatus Verstraetearchaeota archaeon]
MRIKIANRKDYEKILEFSNKAKWKYELKDFYLMEKSGISKTLLLENEIKNEIIGMITTESLAFQGGDEEKSL